MKKYNDVQFVDNIKQPGFNGYLNPNLLIETNYEDNVTLAKKTKVDSHIIDVAVSCLSKYLLTSSIKAAFRIPILGAKLYAYKHGDDRNKYQEILNGLTLINGLNKQSIYVAINIAQFEKLFSKAPILVGTFKRIEVDETTYEVVETLIKRTLTFFKDHGPVGKISFDFIDGKPDTISNASLDIITRDSLWDFITSKKSTDEQHRLLALIHYVMFLHTPEAKALQIKTIGLFDPRLNKSYTIDVKNISVDTLRKVEKILEYNNPIFKK